MKTKWKPTRHYIVVNYTDSQKELIQKEFNTSPYNFSEPFKGCTEGLFIRDTCDYKDIVKRIDGCFNYELLETYIGVHVIFLKGEKMEDMNLKILTDIIHEADTSKTEIAKDKWRLQLCKMIGEMNTQIEKQNKDIQMLKTILLTAAERMEYVETFLDSMFGEDKDKEKTLH